jgi:hypothetical protein
MLSTSIERVSTMLADRARAKDVALGVDLAPTARPGCWATACGWSRSC